MPTFIQTAAVCAAIIIAALIVTRREKGIRTQRLMNKFNRRPVDDLDYVNELMKREKMQEETAKNNLN
jgi:hypothetical protein